MSFIYSKYTSFSYKSVSAIAAFLFGLTIFSSSVLAKSSADDALNSSITRDMALGEPSAPVTIIEYASFTCSHCATFHNLVFDKVVENYVETGKVRFVFREVYFDKFGLAGSLIGRCENDTEFYFDFSNKLFKQQREWMKSKDEADLLSRFQTIAQEAGMAEDKFNACLNDNDSANTLLSWYQANAKEDDIKSTPAFLINGEKFSNMSYEDMSKILDDKLQALSQ